MKFRLFFIIKIICDNLSYFLKSTYYNYKKNFISYSIVIHSVKWLSLSPIYIQNKLSLVFLHKIKS